MDDSTPRPVVARPDSSSATRSALGLSVVVLGAVISATLMFFAANTLLASVSLLGVLGGVAGLLIAKLVLVRTVFRARQLYRDGVPKLGVMVETFEQSVAGGRPLAR
jgi:hypothetical protein